MMSSAAYFTVLAVLLTVTQLGRASTIEWYRTAQDTSDRITQQPTLSFVADFTSDVNITINR